MCLVTAKGLDGDHVVRTWGHVLRNAPHVYRTSQLRPPSTRPTPLTLMLGPLLAPAKRRA